MKKTEIRIGNWILDHEAEPEKTIYWQIENMNRDGVFFRRSSCWSKFEVLEPIPLTEEWFIKFGFVRDGSYWSHPYLNLAIHKTIHEEEVIMIPNKKFALNLKYVHQLQNLYFALTGEELEIQ